MGQTPRLRARVRSSLSVSPSLAPTAPAGARAGTGAAPGHLPSAPPPSQKLLGLQRGRPGLGGMLSALFTIHRPPHGGLGRRARSGVGVSGGKRPRRDTSRSRLPQGHTPRPVPARPGLPTHRPRGPQPPDPPRRRSAATRTPAHRRRRPLTAALGRVLVPPVPGLRAAAAARRGLLLLPVLQLLLEQGQRRVVLGG